jgi:uncharacterized protein (DUF697 family)
MEQETTESGALDKNDSLLTAKTGSETAEITDARRDELATKLVDRFSLWSGAAGLVILVPVADMAVVGALQLQMLRRISEIYGVPFSENLGKSLIASLAGVVIPASAASTAASALKSLPVVGTGIGSLTMSAASAGITYLIGHTFIQHFASGGTLLDFNPPDYREFIKSHAEEVRAGVKSNAGKLSAGAKSGAEKLKSGAEKLRTYFRPTPSAEEALSGSASKETASPST